MAIVNFNARPNFPKLDKSSATVDSLGWWSQDFDTAHGKVSISEYPMDKVATGTTAALMALGLVRHEWIPGYQTNNKCRQTIAFSRSGAWLVFGGQRSGRHVTEGVSTIRIEKISAKKLMVRIDYTDAEQLEIDNRLQAWRTEQDRKASQQFWEDHNKKVAEEDDLLNLAEWRSLMVRTANTGLELALFRIGTGRYRYSDEAMNRILSARDRLLVEIANAQIVPKVKDTSCKVVPLRVA